MEKTNTKDMWFTSKFVMEYDLRNPIQKEEALSDSYWIKKDSFILILREDTSFVKAMMGFCIMKRNAKDAGI